MNRTRVIYDMIFVKVSSIKSENHKRIYDDFPLVWSFVFSYPHPCRTSLSPAAER